MPVKQKNSRFLLQYWNQLSHPNFIVTHVLALFCSLQGFFDHRRGCFQEAWEVAVGSVNLFKGWIAYSDP